MLTKIFAVYDTKIEAYLQPIFLPNVATAIRAITDCVNQSGHQFNKHPSDYVLFDLGSFSDTDCTWDIYSAPKSLGVLIEFIDNSNETIPFDLSPETASHIKKMKA